MGISELEEEEKDAKVQQISEFLHLKWVTHVNEDIVLFLSIKKDGLFFCNGLLLSQLNLLRMRIEIQSSILSVVKF